jgi:hypothetical protein
MLGMIRGSIAYLSSDTRLFLFPIIASGVQEINVIIETAVAVKHASTFREFLKRRNDRRAKTSCLRPVCRGLVAAGADDERGRVSIQVK